MSARARSPTSPDEPARGPRRRRRRLLAGALSVTGHLLVLATLFWARPPPPREPKLAPVMASLVNLPQPAPPKPPEPPKPTPAKTGGGHSAVRPTPPRAEAPPMLVAARTPKPDTSDLLTESQISGAAGVGEGGGGGACDMARAVQRALRRDPLVRTAVSDAHRAGKAIMVWNGDWVRNGEQDGKGLSAVREAIMWEIAFAPEACRKAPMHGLVLLSLADGATRFAVGGGEWRWQDLLATRGVVLDR